MTRAIKRHLSFVLFWQAVGSVGVAYPQLIDYEDTIFYLLTIAAMDGGTPPLSVSL